MRSRPVQNMSISRRLPLTIAVLIAVMVAMFATLTYQEIRLRAEDQFADRVRRSSRQIGTLLEPGIAERIAEVDAVTRDPDLVAALARPDAPTLDAARKRLLYAQEQSAEKDEFELWDLRGTMLLEVHPPEGRVVPQSSHPNLRLAEGKGTAIGPLESDSGVIWFDVTGAVWDESRHVGYVVKRRLLRETPQSRRTATLIADLVGSDAVFLLGDPVTGWTDLLSIAEGPLRPEVRLGTLHRFDHSRTGRRIGAATMIEGTPWYAWVGLPDEAVYGRSREFLRDIILLGVVVTGVGVFAGFLLSRPITEPLGDMTDAATRMAGGDYGHRIDLRGADELGRLSKAFNQMGEAVEAGRRNLEEQVRERTNELHQTLVRLTASEEQFRSLASSSGAGIVTADDRGRISYINTTGERMFGYEPGALIGQPLSVLLPQAERSMILRRYGQLVNAGDSGSEARVVEFNAKRRDGTMIPVELSLASWVVDGERSVGGVIRDITERKALQASLEERARGLEEVNQELAAFSYSVSHDLRAPLRGLQGFSEVMLEDYGDLLDARGRDYLHRISDAGGRMGRLIDELLELSRVSRTELVRGPISLRRIAEEQAAQLQRAFPGRNVRFLTGDVPLAFGDERLVTSVLQNLIENAWKFTANEPDACVEFGATVIDGESVYHVRDNGAGFDMRYADKVFGVFQRLHSEAEFPGTGVGLAIVHRIVLRHGGSVWAEASPGGGATFHFTLCGRPIPAGIEA